MPGRPRKPTLLLALKGTRRADRHADRSDDTPSTGIPEKPKWLNAEAGRMWEHLTTDGEYKQAITQVHLPMLAVFCDLWSQYVASARRPRKGEAPKPRLSASEIAVMTNIGSKLGLTPSDRARLHIPKTAKDDNPWAKLRRTPNAG